MVRYRAASRTLEVHADDGITSLRARDLEPSDWDAPTAELAPRRR